MNAKTSATDDRPAVPATFAEYMREHDIPADHPNLDEWRALWEHELQVEANAPTVIPPCPSWCIRTAGHDYDSTDGWDDELTFERDHLAFKGEVADVQATEHNRCGVVTLDAPIIYLSLDRDGERTAEQTRTVAAELVEAADVLERLLKADL
jgi:hypothetical protein